MLQVEQTHGFVIRSDGTFYADAYGVSLGDLVLKAEARGESAVYPFEARASTSDKDREDERVLQKGLNFAPFMDHGEFNWHHNPNAIVGLPTGKKAWFQDAGWMTQGELIKGMPISPGYDTDMVVKQHNQFKKAGFQRGICCSIEGRVAKRSDCGRYVMKADVFNIALTFRPQNPNCTVNLLAKAFKGISPLIEGDDFYKALSVAGAAPFTKEDLEGAGSRDKVEPKRLVKHLMAKGMPQAQAERHVYKFLWERQQRRA